MWFPILVVTFNFSSPAIYLYANFWIFDVIMHTLGGIAIANMLFIYLKYFGKNWWKQIPSHMQFVFSVSFVGLFGIMWEFYEFLNDLFYKTHMQPSIADTMQDLFFDLVGAVIFTAIYLFFRQHSRSEK